MTAAGRRPLRPHLARRVDALPIGPPWRYQPSWDGIPALAVVEQGQLRLIGVRNPNLERFFPELQESLGHESTTAIYEGTIVTPVDGACSPRWRERMHPAQRHITRITRELPAAFIARDQALAGDIDIRGVDFDARFLALQAMGCPRATPGGLEPGLCYITQTTTSVTGPRAWYRSGEGAGIIGVLAVRADEPFDAPGVLEVMHRRRALCVVGGYRSHDPRTISSLLLGLFEGSRLHYAGHTGRASLHTRRVFADGLEGVPEGTGFTGRQPPPDRITASWVGVAPERVCEVTFDRLVEQRFRTPPRFEGWRFDVAPRSCTFDQILTTRNEPLPMRHDPIRAA